MIAGYYRGSADTLISRGMDLLVAFPLLLLAVGIASACSLGGGCFGGLLQPGLSVVILAHQLEAALEHPAIERAS
jgi:peptide/nickel transport system permease protein